MTEERNAFLGLLRKFLEDVESCFDGTSYQLGAGKKLSKIFQKWNVYFIEVDDIPRINLDEPEDKK